MGFGGGVPEATQVAQARAEHDSEARGRSPSALQHAIFFRTLATLFEAAVPLPKSLELMEESLVGPRLARASDGIRTRLLRGVSLHDAMAAERGAFNSLQVLLVKLGVETGSLHKVLFAIAEHDEKRHGMGQQMKSALTYPCMVFLACLAFLLFVPPLMFNGLFDLLAGSGQPMPLLTRLMAALSRALNVPWTYLGLALLAYGLWRGAQALLANPEARLRIYESAEKLPGLGPVLVSARVAHFSAALAVVMRSGLRLDRGLEIACRSCGSPLIENAAPAMIAALRRGDDLSTLMRHTGLFPKMMWQSAASGEESGQLPDMLTFLSRFYRADLENRLLTLASLLEPLVLGIMGLLVGGMMVACIKPLAASFAQF